MCIRDSSYTHYSNVVESLIIVALNACHNFVQEWKIMKTKNIIDVSPNCFRSFSETVSQIVHKNVCVCVCVCVKFVMLILLVFNSYSTDFFLKLLSTVNIIFCLFKGMMRYNLKTTTFIFTSL